MSEHRWSEPRLQLRSCDAEYIFNIIRDLERAKRQNDKERILIYASELEKFKTLCGFDPRIETFQRAISNVAHDMNLQNNGIIQRSLDTPYCTGETCTKKEKLRTMIGYSQYEISENGSLSLIPEPQPEKSKVPDPEPIHMILLRHNMEKKGDEKIENQLH